MNEDYNLNKNSFRNVLKRLILMVIYAIIVLLILLLMMMAYEALQDRQDAAKYLIEMPDETAAASESETMESTDTQRPSITPYEVPRMEYTSAENVGFDLSGIDELDTFIQGQIDDGFPGAVLMVAKDGYIVFHKAYGYSQKYDGMNLLNTFEDMNQDMLFDLASLTKIYSTTYSIMKLLDEGKISLDGKVSDYIDGYTGGGREDITITMLLSHNAGYTQNYYFYKDDSPYKTRDRDTVYEFLKQIPLDEEPGSTYSYNNLNYMLLGMIVEEVSGMRIDEFARENIYKPLGIDYEVTYLPLDKGAYVGNIAATERMGNTRDGTVYFEGVRQYTLKGEVHDENTYYCMDGVSGHAGLFASCYGLTVLNQLLINGGEYGGVRIYSEETVANWMKDINDKKYQLGFWNAETASSKLKGYVSDSTFYHNGWTGTATIVDLENNLSIILLTNKRHSPCPDGEFEGTDYAIASYTPVIQLVYKALK